MIALPTLYPHQEDIRDRTRAALAQRKRVIMAANPGFGKTRTAKWILGASLQREPRPNQSGRSLFCVHRRGLVDNAIDSFKEDPALPHGVIMSGRATAYGNRVQVASIDTLLSWFVGAGNEYPSDVTFDLIVWDEAHSHHPKFARFFDAHERRRLELQQHPAYVIGLTATPQAEGLADVYREIVLGPSTEWLIAEGFLSPYRYVRATQGALDKLKMRGGEFTKASHCEAMAGLSGDLVRDWEQFARGRPTVGFFPRRSHAREAQEKLEAAGLRVDYVDGETDDDDRRRMFGQLNRAEIDYLCNVQVIERGTDIPRIGCVQLCVAVGSLVRYRQMIGRGSRTHPDKVDCLVLDHGGNVQRHGFFEDDPQWSLDRSSKDAGEESIRPRIECPQCQAVYRGGLCKACGYEPTARERRSQGLEFDGRELREVKRRERTTPKPKSAEELMVGCMYACGRSGRTWKQCMGMFFSKSKMQGTGYRIPKRVKVGRYSYLIVPYGSEDNSRRVSSLYPFTVGEHGGEYLEG